MAEIAGCINGAATVLILTACLSIYGAATFQGEAPQVRVVCCCRRRRRRRGQSWLLICKLQQQWCASFPAAPRQQPWQRHGGPQLPPLTL